jgi:acyl-[acyl-carrier-protein]-phospholipid O-acyltransferase/long-chain-fatty-acid--[acyl-carrier-protein] ligase
LGQVVFVTAVPDEKKGEQLVVLYTREAGTVDVLRDIIRSSDLPNLWKPRRENFFEVDAIPVLGTGKVDLKRLKTLAATCVAQRGEAPVGTDAVREGTA